jgi:phosphatidylserine decarboxylase
MVADGIYYALAFAAGGGFVSYMTKPVFGVPLFVLAAFCLYFFRDPEREDSSGPVAVSRPTAKWSPSSVE